MSMKDRFSAEEWELLCYLPFQVFVMVSAADGKIDNKEWDAFDEGFRSAAMLKNELHRELLIGLLQSDMKKYIEGSVNFQKNLHSAELLRPILREKLNPQEYQDFLISVFYDGVRVARASGGGFMSSSPISREEAQALATIAGIYEIDLKPA